MRKFWPNTVFLVGFAALMLLLPTEPPSRHADAGVSCSVPFNLTNGTTADASQVMANYTAILTCLSGSTAANGANSDITSLSGLTTPLSAAQGGTVVFTGGTSSGTNAITVTAAPIGFSLAANNKIVFVAGGSNTTATTLNVSATGIKSLFRPTPVGPLAMVGGEIVAGQLVEAVYDGTQFQMTSRPALDMVPGMVFDWASTTCPVGSLEAIGGNVVQATYPALSSVLGATWGAPGGGNFVIPDLRGRATFSRDISGSGRITVAGGNFDGTTAGNVGGQQNNVVNKANLAAFALNVTDPGHQHAPLSGQFLTSAAGSPYTNSGGGVLTSQATTASATTGITVSSGGSSTPLPTLSNAAIVLKCVKA